MSYSSVYTSADLVQGYTIIMTNNDDQGYLQMDQIKNQVCDMQSSQINVFAEVLVLINNGSNSSYLV